MDHETHRIDRGVVGKVLWIVRIRPGLSYVSRELSRTLWSPTNDDCAGLKHAIRYLKGTEVYRLSIRPEATTPTDATLDVNIHIDSDCVGCATTRKSTT